MRKSRVFTYLVFALTTFYSCDKENQNEDVYPIAAFEYEIEELTVKFKNISSDAITYNWTFGDGSTSTEKDPTHTYSEAGTYDIELFATNEHNNTHTAKRSVTVKIDDEDSTPPLPTFNIEIDGKFDDWIEIPEEHLSIAVLDESQSELHRLKEVKLIADNKYMYMYMKMDTLHANAMDIYLNVDGDTETGYNSWMWENTAANYLMQGFFSDNYDMRLAEYDENEGGAWGWLTPNVVETGMGLMEVSAMNGIEESIVEFEAAISLIMIPNTSDEIKIMIGHSGVESDAWTTSGGLPTVTESGEKNEGIVVRLK